MSQNHYQVLGVAPSAAAADIKRAYRQLVVRFHPDKHGGDLRYEDQFKAVAVAYRVLGDAGRRAAYDHQLAQAARRVQDTQRQQHYRPASQHVYGVPMPRPAPLRTRPPAGAHERHYQRIPPQRARFNARDWLLTLLFIGGIVLAALAVKATMDRVSASSNYDDGLRAYARGDFAAAYTLLDEALHFRPDRARARQRRGELELLARHDARAARADLRAALRQPLPRRTAARLHYYLGRCETALGRPAAAERRFTNALLLDHALSAAYLARGTTRLLDLRQPAPALADLDQGIALRQQAQAPPPWHHLLVRGVALAALGRYEAARAAYSQVLAAHPRDGRTHFLLGRLAARTRDSVAACGFYGRAVALGYEYARPAAEGCK